MILLKLFKCVHTISKYITAFQYKEITYIQLDNYTEILIYLSTIIFSIKNISHKIIIDKNKKNQIMLK